MVFDELSNAFFGFSLRRLGGKFQGGLTPPPSPTRSWKIQRPIRARVDSRTLPRGIITIQLSWKRHEISPVDQAAAELNPRLTGGLSSDYFCPPPLSFFCDISRSYVRIIATFSVPSKPSILHVLTKGKLTSFDTSAINDSVMSCFPF